MTVAGHINEAGDVFAEDYPFPDVAEGEPVAILNAGGYLQAMSSTHCLRPMGYGGLPGAGGASVIEPEVEGYVRVEGGRLPYEVAGEGSGVVLAHAGIADTRQWDPQWDALIAGHRVVRYDLRGFGRADVSSTPVLEPRRPGRRDGRRGPGARGARRAARGRARSSSTRRSSTRTACRASSTSAAGSAGPTGESTPEEQAAFERGEALEEAKDWAAHGRASTSRIWVDGFGQPEGRAPAAAREAVRRMTYETYVQEKPYGDTVVLDPPAVGRLGELRVPVLVIVGLLDESGTIGSAPTLLAARAPRRAADRAAGRRPHAQPRAPEWFTETLLEFLAEVGVQGLGASGRRGRPSRSRGRSRSGASGARRSPARVLRVLRAKRDDRRGVLGLARLERGRAVAVEPHPGEAASSPRPSGGRAA